MRKLLIALSILLLIFTVSACADDSTVVESKPLEMEVEVDQGESIELSEDVDSPMDGADTADTVKPEEVVEKEDTVITNEIEVEEDSIASDTALYKVVRVVDGDTIVVSFNGVDEKVRFIGVDTPESVHSDSSKNTKEGIVASDFTKELLDGKSVSLEFDVSERDRYGRLLAYVYLDGEMVNKTLLKEGYAQVATYPPNVAYVDDFTELQRVARENEVGLWGITQEETAQSNAIVTPIEGDASEHRLIGSVNSNKYHKEGYTHNGQIAEHNLVYFESEDDAISKGYVPCKICYK